MIDTSAIYRNIRLVIATVIGGELSKTKSGKPAIVKARANNTRLEYPFATMDIITIMDANSWLTNRTVDSDGKTVYNTHKHVPIQISVRADSQLSYDLCQRLHKAFSFLTVQDLLQDNLEASIVSTDAVTATPDPLSDRLQEFNSFNVVLGIADIDTDESSFSLEGITVDGNITTPDGEEYTTNPNVLLGIWVDGVWNYDNIWSGTQLWGGE